MNKIVALWVHPRSLSTVMERILIERGDFKAFHEPFAYLYYVHDKKGSVPFMKVDPNHPTSFADTKKMILDAADENPVCFKDMAYYVGDYIFEDDEFLNRMTNVFMIRDVEKTVLSYYKVDPNVDRDEIGFEYLFKIFRKVADLNNNQPPPVIVAEDLENDPEGTVKALCEKIDIPFMPESLSWEARPPEEMKDWDEWHKDLFSSTGIQKDMEKFDMSLDDVPKLRSYYEYHLPFYEALLKHRTKP